MAHISVNWIGYGSYLGYLDCLWLIPRLSGLSLADRSVSWIVYGSYLDCLWLIPRLSELSMAHISVSWTVCGSYLG